MREWIPRIIRFALAAFLLYHVAHGRTWAIVTCFASIWLANEVVTLYMVRRAAVDRDINKSFERLNSMMQILNRYMKKMRKILK